MNMQFTWTARKIRFDLCHARSTIVNKSTPDVCAKLYSMYTVHSVLRTQYINSAPVNGSWERAVQLHIHCLMSLNKCSIMMSLAWTRQEIWKWCCHRETCMKTCRRRWHLRSKLYPIKISFESKQTNTVMADNYRWFGGLCKVESLWIFWKGEITYYELRVREFAQHVIYYRD